MLPSRRPAPGCGNAQPHSFRELWPSVSWEVPVKPVACQTPVRAARPQLSGSWTEQQCSSGCSPAMRPPFSPELWASQHNTTEPCIVTSGTAGAIGPGDFQPFSLEAEATERNVHPVDVCPLLALPCSVPEVSTHCCLY